MSSADITANDSRPTAFVWVTLAIVVALGLGLRLSTFSGSLWLDELHTAWVVNGDFEQVSHRATMGNQSPAIYWLLWPYVRIVGLHGWTLRLPSLVASVLSIVLVFALARRWTSSSLAGLLAAVALACEANSSLFFASEARVYACVQLIALAQLLVFANVLRGASIRQRVLLVVLSWALFYLHYTTAILLIAEVFTWVVLCCLKFPTDYKLSSVALDMGIFALGCLPAVPQLLEIYARRDSWALFIPRAGWQEALDLLPHGQALVLVLAIWSAIAVVSWRRKVPLRLDALPLALTCAWLIIPLYLAWQLTERDVARLFFLRYLAYVLPAGGVLVGVLAATLTSRRVALAFGSIAALLLVGWNVWLIYPVLSGDSPVRNENWHQAVATLNERAWRRDEPLFVASGLIEADALRTSDAADLREYCLFPLHAAYPLEAYGIHEEPLPFQSPGRLSEANQQRVATWLTEHDSLLFLVRGTQDHAEQTAADVERSLGGKVSCGDFEGFGDLWLIQVRPAR